ncbi:MAG TPA: hypothetical protein VGI45_13660 [Terracidiphilus sp.]
MTPKFQQLTSTTQQTFYSRAHDDIALPPSQHNRQVADVISAVLPGKAALQSDISV